jgi:inosine/xanthosine triphosphatase
MPVLVIASRNPVKSNAILRGFQTYFPEVHFETQNIDVPSGVREQPLGDEETRQGALNRIQAARAACPQGDYWTAIEGGVMDVDNHMSAFAWIAISTRQRTGWSRSASFFLPQKVAELVRQGVELGHADDKVFNRSNSKQNNGAVGILTADAIDREELYTHAVLLALIPFLNPTLY